MKLVTRFLLGCCFIALLFPNQSVAAEEYVAEANHAIAVEVSTGKVLYEKDATTTTSIASITNLLTAYLVYEAMEEGQFILETPVEISDYPYNLSLTSPVANVTFANRSYTIRQLLQASLISSASSASIALAEKVAGSEQKFVDLMRAKLESWGISDATIVNASGVNNSYLGDARYPGSSETDENKLSATAVAIIAYHLLTDYPQVLEITAMTSYDFSGITYSNSNLMLKNMTYSRNGVDGLKTGTTDSSGASFVATSYENNMRVITVILNATDGKENPDNRFVATNNLLNYVYQYFSLEELVSEGKSYNKSKVPVFNGKSATSPAVAANDLYVIRRNKNTEPTLATFTSLQTNFEAPLKKGSVIGTLQLNDTDLIGQGYIDEQPSIDMLAPKTVTEAHWPVSWWNHFVRYVNENL
ncbi:TPA: D-alanyl-D-alanine carboxypeptidase PBP3 [Streptococcus suis]